jgi:hypothetical protein
MKSGTNEGISFEVSSLTDDLFTDSFLGGGDASQFTPSGHRGTLTSQLSNANILDSGGGAPHKFAIQFTFDLNTGKASENWNNPVTGHAETVNVTLTFFKSATAPALPGQLLLLTFEEAHIFVRATRVNREARKLPTLRPLSVRLIE